MKPVEIVAKSKAGRVLEVHEGCTGSSRCAVEIRLSDCTRRNEYGNTLEAEVHLDPDEAEQLLDAVTRSVREWRRDNRPPAERAYYAWWVGGGGDERQLLAFDQLRPEVQAQWAAVVAELQRGV